MNIGTLELAMDKLKATRHRYRDTCWRVGDPPDEITQAEVDTLIKAAELVLAINEVVGR